MIDAAGYRLSSSAAAIFRAYLTRRSTQARFANARSVRNAVERARLRHASRLLDRAATELTKDDLMRLEPDDFLASRVFADPVPAPANAAAASAPRSPHAQQEGNPQS